MPMPPMEGHSQRTPFPAGLAEFGATLHPARLAARLDPSLSPATLSRLQKSLRLQDRLAWLMLGDELGGIDGTWEPDVLLGKDPRRAALLAGGIWHARSLLKLIAGPELALLAERVGTEVQPFAVRHLAQAVAGEPVADPEQLALLIEQDGHACLGAWLEGLPALARHRVLLRLPPGTAAESPAPAHREAAGPLLALVLARFAAEGQAP